MTGCPVTGGSYFDSLGTSPFFHLRTRTAPVSEFFFLRVSSSGILVCMMSVLYSVVQV